MIYVYEVFQMMHIVKFKNYSTRENKWKAPYFSKDNFIIEFWINSFLKNF